MRRWLGYALAGLLLTLLAGLVAQAVAGEAGRRAVWFAAGLAYVLQLGAFGAMLAVRDQPRLFLAGWAAGIGLRFAAVGAVAFWLTRTDALPRAPTLVSLVTFVVLLLFLEPVFIGRGRAAEGGSHTQGGRAGGRG